MRSPSMWVMVPVTERSRSPSISEMPTAAPGATFGSGPTEAEPPPPPSTGTKPIAENTPRAQSKAAAENPEKTSGSASGRSVAPGPATASCRGRRSAARICSRSSGAASAPSAAVAWKRADAARGARVLVASIMSPIGVTPAIGSLPKGKA